MHELGFRIGRYAESPKERHMGYALEIEDILML
jgi:hypothetical protein